MANNELVLVTGGAGFIGSHLVRGLLRNAYRVRILDDFSSGKGENLIDVASQIEIIEGDVVNCKTARRATEGVDYVLHHAAIASVPHSMREPLINNRVNVNGTLALLCAARDAGVKRLVYAASSSAYGNDPTMPKIETMASDPISPYAVAKLASENYCRAFYQTYGLETVCLRYFNIFGPRQDPKSEYAAVIPRFIVALQNGQPLTIYGDGEQSRDFCYVDNVVQANLEAMMAADAPGEVCNVACGESFTLNQLVGLLSEIMGVKPQVQYAAERQGDVKHSVAHTGKAHRLLGYVPQVSMQQGLARTVEYFESRVE